MRCISYMRTWINLPFNFFSALTLAGGIFLFIGIWFIPRLGQYPTTGEVLSFYEAQGLTVSQVWDLGDNRFSIAFGTQKSQITKNQVVCLMTGGEVVCEVEQ